MEVNSFKYINKENLYSNLIVIHCGDSLSLDEISSKLEKPIHDELIRIAERKNPVIKIVGIGGSGCKIINNIIDNGLLGVTFIGAAVDSKPLETCKAEVKIPLGEKTFKGRCAGANPEIGQKAAEESIDEIVSHIQDADMVFITAGMGGGTGTGAAPIIAKASRDCGALTAAFVTKPFSFEGKNRQKRAEKGIQSLSNFVDSLLVIPNDLLIETGSKDDSMLDRFEELDILLTESLQRILSLPQRKDIPASYEPEFELHDFQKNPIESASDKPEDIYLDLDLILKPNSEEKTEPELVMKPASVRPEKGEVKFEIPSFLKEPASAPTEAKSSDELSLEEN